MTEAPRLVLDQLFLHSAKQKCNGFFSGRHIASDIAYAHVPTYMTIYHESFYYVF